MKSTKNVSLMRGDIHLIYSGVHAKSSVLVPFWRFCIFFIKSITISRKNKETFFVSNMPSSSKSKKRASDDTASPLNKRQNTVNTRESLIWVDISNKTSWVWKHFKLATDGRTYCFYTETTDNIEKTCDFSCSYNSQTSSMNYHLNTAHKVYEKKGVVCTV